tara:strand:+ start:121 stop:495 length:375 start_codon:yes stop_codon:yes gene_type:complete
MKASLIAVKKWETLFNKNDISIVDTYATNGILIGTFAIKIKKGRETIKPYFEGLFKKQNLRVKFDKGVFVNELDEAYIVSGFYEFSFDENGERKKIDTRYSFVVQNVNGQMLIVNHHSSEIPNN